MYKLYYQHKPILTHKSDMDEERPKQTAGDKDMRFLRGIENV